MVARTAVRLSNTCPASEILVCGRSVLQVTCLPYPFSHTNPATFHLTESPIQNSHVQVLETPNSTVSPIPNNLPFSQHIVDERVHGTLSPCFGIYPIAPMKPTLLCHSLRLRPHVLTFSSHRLSSIARSSTD